MKIVSTLLICVLLFSTVALPQEKAAASFTTRSELVIVPVVVTAHNAPVTGLSKADFKLLHDGAPEQIAIFEEITAVAPSTKRVDLPPNTVQNFAPADSNQDVVIILLDFLNSNWSSAARIRVYLKDIADRLAETKTPATVLLLSRKGLMQAHSFTTDITKFANTVEKWAAHESSGTKLSDPLTIWNNPLAVTDDAFGSTVLQEYATAPGYIDAVKLDRAEMTQNALEQLAEAYRGIPGRKKLVWLSTGFPIGLELSDTGAPQGVLAEFRIHDKALRSWRALSSANIAVYPVDTAGAEGNQWQPPSNRNAVPRSVTFSMQSNQSSMMEAAARTGGKFCTDDPNRCMVKAVADAPHYYILGFYLHADAKPGWHKTKVELNRPDVSIRAREGFLVFRAQHPSDTTKESAKGEPPKSAVKQASKDSDQSPQQDVVVTAISSPLDYTGVPLRLRWSIGTNAKEPTLDLVLSAPPGAIAVDPQTNLVDIDMLVALREPGSKTGQSFPVTIKRTMTAQDEARLASSGFTFKKQVPLRPGRHEVRFFLRDNVNDRIGTVSTVIEVPKS